VIRKQVKQRQDSIESFEKSGRTELAEKEKAEVAVLNSVTASGDERGGIATDSWPRRIVTENRRPGRRENAERGSGTTVVVTR